MSDTDSVKRGPGRPRKNPLPERATHEPVHEPTRGGVVVRGRDGELLTRHRPTSAQDKYEFPDSLKEPGWSYQWIAQAVIGNTQVVRSTNHEMSTNGWRPCASKRIADYFGIKGSKTITFDDLVLHERPAPLTEEARAEEVRNAKQLINDRNASLKLAGVKNSMPDGFSMGGKYRGTGGDIRMSIDRGLDLEPAPHPLAEPGE